MQKIIVIGSPGAGKSTFSRALRDKTGLPLYYLDMLWHKPDRTNVTREEFDARLSEILELDKWIIDGNYNRTLDVRMSACDTVFLLDLPTDICLSGAQARVGQKREEMPWVETEFDPEFKEYIKTFSQQKLPYIYELLSKYGDKSIVIFKSRDEINAYLKD